MEAKNPFNENFGGELIVQIIISGWKFIFFFFLAN
jgi:hypothetical protein